MKSLEAPGVFWLPSAPQRRIAGKVVVSGDGTTLTLHDNLRAVSLPPNQVTRVAPERVAEPTVFGRLTDRESEVTLLDVSGISITVPFGDVTETFDVATVLVGGHVANRPASRISIEFDVLRYWVHGAGEIFFNQSELCVDIARHILHEAEVDGHTVSLVQSASTRLHPSIEVHRRTAFEIVGDGLSIDTMSKEWIRPLHDLLIVALGGPVAVTSLRASMSATIGVDIDVTIYTHLVQPEAHDGAKPLDLRSVDSPSLLLPDDPACAFASFVPAWFQLRGENLDTVVQLCAPFYAMFIYSEHRYGSVFQAAEALCRTRFESRQRPKDEHRDRVTAIVDAARASGVDENDLEWANNVLRSRNDRPLKDLIADLLDHSGVVDEKQRDHLAPRMATARTGVSHGGAAGVDTMTRHWLGQVLQWMVRAHLLRDLGVTPEAMSKRLASKAAFRRALEKATARPGAEGTPS